MNRGGSASATPRGRGRRRPRGGAGGAPIAVTSPQGSGRGASSAPARGRGGSSRGGLKTARVRAEEEARAKAAASAKAEAEAEAKAEKEAEKERKAEEKRQKAEEERVREMEARVKEAEEAKKEKAARRAEERRRNVGFDDARPSETELRRLDSSLKKCSGFVRRLGGTENLAEPALLRDCRGLNLTRYITEVVAAIVESKVKASETEAAARLCGEMHRRYVDFGELLAGALGAAVGDGKKEIAARRTAMRMLVELFAVGVLKEPAVVFGAAKEAMKVGRGISEAELANMSVVASFAKVGRRLFLMPVGSATDEVGVGEGEGDDGGTGSEVVADGEASGKGEGGPSEEDPLVWETDVLSAEVKAPMTAMLQVYARELCSLLDSVEGELHTADTVVLTARMTRGIEDDEAIASAASLKKSQERVFGAAVAICEALGNPAPAPYVFQPNSGLGATSIGRDARVIVGSFGGGPRAARLAAQGATDEEVVEETQFEDEEEYNFYRVFPDSLREAGKGKNKTPASENDGDSAAAVIDVPSDDGKPALESGTASKEGSNLLPPDLLISRLPMVDGEETSNAFLEQFVLVAHQKGAVKRLTKALSQVPSNMLNALPSYARIAAGLHFRFPDIATTVGTSMDEDLRALIARADHDGKSTGSFIKACRYVGEYVKFELLSPNVLFDLLGLCVKDFTSYKVEIACHLLETCGRYLYRSPATSVRMGNMLDTVWRLKSVKNLEARHNALVETAYFVSRPRGTTRRSAKKKREPLREYIRWRLYTQLQESNVDWTANHLRKLPWNGDLERYVVRKFLDVTCMRFYMYSSIARLLAGMSADRPSLGVSVCDGLLEAVLVGLERNDGRDSQRRLAEVVLLGEIYNCGLLSSELMFQLLYLFITFGSSSCSGRTDSALSNSEPSRLLPAGAVTISSGVNHLSSQVSKTLAQTPDDLAGDYFRVRLVCCLLDACGRKLVVPASTGGSTRSAQTAKRQIEVFWVYFERYILTKTAQAGLGHRLPLHMEHIVVDTFEKIIQPLRSRLAPTDLRHKIKSRNGAASAQQSSKAARRGADPDQSPPEDPLYRSKTLEEAVSAIGKVESSALDLALVHLPDRSYTIRSKASSMANALGAKPFVPRSAEVVNEAEEDIDEVEEEGEGDAERDLEASSIDGEREDSPSVDAEHGEVSSDGESDQDGSESATDDGADSEDGVSSSGEESSSSESDVDDEDDFEVTPPRHAQTEEEDEFEKELAAFMSAEVTSAKQSFTGHTTLDRMAIPIGLMAKHRGMERVAAAEAAVLAPPPSTGVPGQPEFQSRMGGEAVEASVAGQSSTVAFKMLVRRGGKSHMRELAVPSASTLAVAQKESESVGAAAHEEQKRLVLESSTIQDGDTAADMDGLAEGDGGDLIYGVGSSSKRKEQTISERRAQDEAAVLNSLFRTRRRR